MESKIVTYKHLKIGQKITGTKEGNCDSSFIAFVKDKNAAFVMVEMWKEGGEEKRINASAMFKIEMTEEEFEDKYREEAKKVLKNIQNKLHADEIGYHELWNSWLYGSPYEIAKYCVENNMSVIGHSSDIIPKTAMFSGDSLDIGVCAEYEDGEHIWCHYRYSDIEDMLRKYKNLLE